VPITFALDAEDAQRVAFAESFAEHVRLALVAPGDTSAPAQSDRTYTLGADSGTGGKP
jgi:pilus assembly protein CpaB